MRTREIDAASALPSCGSGTCEPARIIFPRRLPLSIAESATILTYSNTSSKAAASARAALSARSSPQLRIYSPPGAKELSTVRTKSTPVSSAGVLSTANTSRITTSRDAGANERVTVPASPTRIFTRGDLGISNQSRTYSASLASSSTTVLREFGYTSAQ